METNIVLLLKFTALSHHDIRWQRDMHDLYESLQQDGFLVTPLSPSSTLPRDTVAKSETLDLVFGAIQLSIPASLVLASLKLFLREYFATKTTRTLEIWLPDGLTVRLLGYDEAEASRLLEELLQAHCGETPPLPLTRSDGIE